MIGFLLEHGATLIVGVVVGLLLDRVRSLRERRGALRRLRAEIGSNQEIMQIVRERRGDQPQNMVGDRALLSLNTGAWRDTTRAAVLPDALFEELDSYYSPLEKLLSLLRLEGSMDEFMERWLRAGISELKPEWNVARSRNPYVEYMEQVLEAQDRARDRLSEYLARPLWRFW